jgi:Flp pilus assembly pilin Flp
LPNLARQHAHADGAATRQREEGQTMAEYSVALSVITIGAITAISLLSGHVLNTISGVADILPGH